MIELSLRVVVGVGVNAVLACYPLVQIVAAVCVMRVLLATTWHMNRILEIWGERGAGGGG